MINEYIKNLIRDETKNMLIYGSKKCKLCGEQASHIHHLVYRWKPKIKDIEFLCKRCHNKLKKPRIKIIIEDEIDYTPLSELTKKDLEFIEKVKSLGKKSICPLQLDAIIGFADKLASNKGLPNPSPFVNET